MKTYFLKICFLCSLYLSSTTAYANEETAVLVERLKHLQASLEQSHTALQMTVTQLEETNEHVIALQQDLKDLQRINTQQDKIISKLVQSEEENTRIKKKYMKLGYLSTVFVSGEQ